MSLSRLIRKLLKVRYCLVCKYFYPFLSSQRSSKISYSDYPSGLCELFQNTKYSYSNEYSQQKMSLLGGFPLANRINQAVSIQLAILFMNICVRRTRMTLIGINSVNLLTEEELELEVTTPRPPLRGRQNPPWVVTQNTSKAHQSGIMFFQLNFLSDLLRHF